MSTVSDAPPAVLAADVGNSRIKYGWFAPAKQGPPPWPECREFTVTPLEAPVPVEQLRRWQSGGKGWLILAGSNPRVVERVAREWEAASRQRAWVLRQRSALPLTIAVESPETVGLDRLLNAVAVNVLRPRERAAIVVDSGTATTVDLITAEGAFAGGAILPGLALSAQALHHYTALLPLLSLADLGPDLPAPLGRNTRGALRSGIYWGQVGAIRELIGAFCTAQGLPSPWGASAALSPWLLFTGGGAPWLSVQFPGVRQIPSLALHGLVLTAWSQPALFEEWR
uniref:Type III pantothenate kinase n=1 Tax=Schlesneria paludicola TaxID=360056 RepID=A0A7C4QU77_9PLAN